MEIAKLILEPAINNNINLYSRYAQGPQTVTMSQLPSEDGREFNALKTIKRTNNEFDAPEFDLELHDVDKETDHVEPINWFGILVPQSLRTAQDRYEKAIELVVESANVEQRLKKNYQLIDKLKSIKVEFENSEE